MPRSGSLAGARPAGLPHSAGPATATGDSAPPPGFPPPAAAAVDCIPPAALPPPGPTALITTEVANLREYPGLTCPVLRELPPGTALTVRSGPVRGDDVGWLLVEVEGVGGWVSARLVAPPAPATPTRAAHPTPTSILATATAPPTTASPTATPGVPTAVGCVPPSPLPPVRERRPLVTTADVNLRRGPGIGCDIVTVLRDGTGATPRSGPVRADGRLWVLIAVEGATGWAASDFLVNDD